MKKTTENPVLKSLNSFSPAPQKFAEFSTELGFRGDTNACVQQPTDPTEEFCIRSVSGSVT